MQNVNGRGTQIFSTMTFTAVLESSQAIHSQGNARRRAELFGRVTLWIVVFTIVEFRPTSDHSANSIGESRTITSTRFTTLSVCKRWYKELRCASS